MTCKEISDSFERSVSAGIDIRTEMYYMENVLKEIGCNISYLEDAPDEMLIIYDDRLDGICERLRTLAEYLHNVKTTAII